MQEMFSASEIKSVEDRLKLFEEKTGVELLLVVAKECDPYPAASLRFGLIAGFVASFIFSYSFEFSERWMWPLSFMFVVIVMVWIGHFRWAKKLALADWEIERETKEKAIELFHSLGTSAVSSKVTAMIMLSELEHMIEVLVDKKLHEKISQSELQELVRIVQSHCKLGTKSDGLIQSIGVLENLILSQFGGKAAEISPSQLSDTIHFINY